MSAGQMIKFSLSKLIGELIGTFFLTIFFTSNEQGTILGGLFTLNVFIWKLSGSHFNPAVTLACMVRKTERMPVVLGIAYIVVQILGAYLGAMTYNFWMMGIPVLQYFDDFIMRSLVQELLSTFVFIVFFLSVTDTAMKFSSNDTLNCLINASGYVGARGIFYGQAYRKVLQNATTSYGAVMNPAIALGIALAGYFGEGWNSWKAIYLYPTVPFGAALLSVVFYEFIYKKTIQTLAHYGDEGDMANASLIQTEQDERMSRSKTKEFHPVR